MGVVFGGRSVEHDVSIITGLQACEVLAERHEPVPIYIDREGRWFSGAALRDVATYRAETIAAERVLLDVASGVLRTAPAAGAPARRRGLLRSREGDPAAADGAPLRLDVVLPACHGTQGEDGALQGMLELTDLPYAGPTLESAVLAMNKAITKAMLRAAGVPVLEDLVVRRSEYAAARAPGIIARVTARFGLPVYVKPASLGSSVGVTRCAEEAELADALELAFELDRLVLIEPAVDGGREINCAVLGRPGEEPRVSLCEEPLSSEGFLSFEDKYLRSGGAKSERPPAGKSPGPVATSSPAAPAATGAKGEGMASAQRIIPAPISAAQTARAQELARRTFQAIGGTGVTRVDLLLDADERLFVNEPNTIPGSFAYYLFQDAGLPFAELLDALIDIAFAEHDEKRATTRTFESNLLALRGQGKAA